MVRIVMKNSLKIDFYNFHLEVSLDVPWTNASKPNFMEELIKDDVSQNSELVLSVNSIQISESPFKNAIDEKIQNDISQKLGKIRHT